MIRFNSNIFPDCEGAYIVGGAVRDFYTGRNPEDYDIVVEKEPRRYAMALGENTNGHVITLGKPGMILYRVISDKATFDITPLAGSTILEDLAARDFTVNAIALNLSSGVLIDPFNGREDITNQQIRMVAESSFINDPIRLLRAYRFSSLLGFTLETETEKSIGRNRHLITQTSPERIHAELLKIFENPESHFHIRQMCRNGLLFEIIPELDALRDCPPNHHHAFNGLEHTLQTVRHLENALNRHTELIPETLWTSVRIEHHLPLLKYAALLHDVGKPPCMTEKNGIIHYYGHEARGASLAAAICDRLKFSTYEKQYLTAVIQNHLLPLFLFKSFTENTLTRKAMTRFFRTCGDVSPDVLFHSLADNLAKHRDGTFDENPFMDFIRSVLTEFVSVYVPILNSHRILTGRDLIDSFSLEPSPLFKTILDQIEESRLSGEITSRDQAMEMVRTILEMTNNHSSS